MTLFQDYRLTLEGELSMGRPNTITTRLSAFKWALRRFLTKRRPR